MGRVACKTMFLVSLGFGCTFGSGGEAKGTSATIGAPDTTDDGGDGSSSGATSTTNASSTSPPASTTTPVDGSSSGDASDGVGPMSTSDVSTSDAGDSSSGDPPPPNPYSPCVEGCAVAASQCSVGACAQPCQGVADCPAPPSGNAVPNCPAPYWSYCDLDCAGGLTCPAGMTCIQHQYGWSCGYP